MYINTLVSTSIKATSFFSLRVTVFFFPANRSSNSERLAKLMNNFLWRLYGVLLLLWWFTGVSRGWGRLLQVFGILFLCSMHVHFYPAPKEYTFRFKRIYVLLSNYIRINPGLTDLDPK